MKKFGFVVLVVLASMSALFAGVPDSKVMGPIIIITPMGAAGPNGAVADGKLMGVVTLDRQTPKMDFGDGAVTGSNGAVADGKAMGPIIKITPEPNGAVVDGKEMGPDRQTPKMDFPDDPPPPPPKAVADGKVMGPSAIITPKGARPSGAVADTRVMGVQVQKTSPILSTPTDDNVIDLNKGF